MEPVDKNVAAPPPPIEDDDDDDDFDSYSVIEQGNGDASDFDDDDDIDYDDNDAHRDLDPDECDDLPLSLSNSIKVSNSDGYNLSSLDDDDDSRELEPDECDDLPLSSSIRASSNNDVSRLDSMEVGAVSDILINNDQEAAEDLEFPCPDVEGSIGGSIEGGGSDGYDDEESSLLDQDDYMNHYMMENNEMRTLRTQLEHYESRAHQLELELSSTKAELTNYQQTASMTFAQEKERMKHDLQTKHEASQRKLEEENERLKVQLQEYIANSQVLQREVKTSAQTPLKAEIGELTSELRKAQTDNEILLRANTTHQVTNEKLTVQLKQATSNNETLLAELNKSKSESEAMPFFEKRVEELLEELKRRDLEVQCLREEVKEVRQFYGRREMEMSEQLNRASVLSGDEKKTEHEGSTSKVQEKIDKFEANSATGGIVVGTGGGIGSSSSPGTGGVGGGNGGGWGVTALRASIGHMKEMKEKQIEQMKEKQKARSITLSNKQSSSSFEKPPSSHAERIMALQQLDRASTVSSPLTTPSIARLSSDGSSKDSTRNGDNEQTEENALDAAADSPRVELNKGSLANLQKILDTNKQPSSTLPTTIVDGSSPTSKPATTIGLSESVEKFGEGSKSNNVGGSKSRNPLLSSVERIVDDLLEGKHNNSSKRPTSPKSQSEPANSNDKGNSSTSPRFSPFSRGMSKGMASMRMMASQIKSHRTNMGDGGNGTNISNNNILEKKKQDQDKESSLRRNSSNALLNSVEKFVDDLLEGRGDDTANNDGKGTKLPPAVPSLDEGENVSTTMTTTATTPGPSSSKGTPNETTMKSPTTVMQFSSDVGGGKEEVVAGSSGSKKEEGIVRKIESGSESEGYNDFLRVCSSTKDGADTAASLSKKAGAEEAKEKDGVEEIPVTAAII